MHTSAHPGPLKTYRWPEGSLIPRIDLREQAQGNVIAYLYAPESLASAVKLRSMREAFDAHGWTGSSDMREGQPVLRLTGLKSAQALITLLETQGYVQGEKQLTQQRLRVEDNETALDKLRGNSLRTSGLIYMLGDLLFIWSGIKRGKDIAQMGTGVAFAVGDGLLMGFGGKDDRRQFQSLLGKLRNHLEKKGIAIPEGSAINAETMAKPEGFLEKSYDFIHAHINPIKIMAEVVGGGLYFKAGINQKNPRKQTAGAIIVAGWLAALLIHEKKRDPEEWEKAGLLKKAELYIQEKPLRLAGWAGLAHNGLSTIGALEERAKHDGTHFYRWDLAGISAMLLANSLYSISHKATGGSIHTDAIVEDVYGLAAQVLNRESPELRSAAIDTVATFLGERPEIKDSREQIVVKLHEKMETMLHNPWFTAIRDSGWQELSR